MRHVSCDANILGAFFHSLTINSLDFLNRLKSYENLAESYVGICRQAILNFSNYIEFILGCLYQKRHLMFGPTNSTSK